MLGWIIGILLLFWLAGLIFHIAGGIIHILLVIAIVLFVINLFRKRNRAS